MEIDPELLRKYWSQECSEEEKHLVKQWLEAGEPMGEYDIGEDSDEHVIRQELWASLSEKVSPAPSPVRRAPLSKQNVFLRSKKLIFVSGIAASILVIGTLFFIFSGFPKKITALPLSQYKQIVVPYGEKANIILADGTTIHLNSGSTLRYPQKFGKKRRHVILEGEAFFRVAKDHSRPFIAETARSNTLVLGTRFNLRDFSSEPSSSVVVEEGKVQFTGRGFADAFILLPNERAVFTGHAIQKAKVQVSSYIDWKENVLRFNSITLTEAIPFIERWYNVRIRLNDPALGGLRIKGSFKQKSLRKLMDDVSFLTNLQYRIKERDVLLYK